MKSRSISVDQSCQTHDFFDLRRDDILGRFSIRYDNILYDCLMNPPSSENEKKSLFVIFSGSRNIKDPVPVFKRWSYYPFCDGYVLSIADPMLTIHKNLNLGWYYGSKDVSFLEQIASIIQKVQSLLEIENKDTYLFGSSGGGYASVHLSCYLNDTTHIALNPQISIKDYKHVGRLQKTVGISLEDKDPLRRNETMDIICENISTNRFFIIQNVDDKEHCTKQLFPLMKKMNVDELSFGLNRINKNMLVWIYDLIGGHSAQGDQLTFSYIIYMAERMASENFEISDFDNFVFRNISCLMKERERYKYAYKKKAKAGKD